jgi:hypothetical protein
MIDLSRTAGQLPPSPYHTAMFSSTARGRFNTVNIRVFSPDA